jgi:hypothetical protein
LAFAAGVKDEVAEFLEERDVVFEHRHLWGSNQDKEAILRISHCYVSDLPLDGYLQKHGNYANGWWYFTPRTLLQYWGTEYRRAQDELYWVKKCMTQRKDGVINIITDVRFPNEVQAVKDAGGLVVRIERGNRSKVSNQEHPSETALDGYIDWDVLLLNDDTLATYTVAVQNILRGIVNEKRAA